VSIGTVYFSVKSGVLFLCISEVRLRNIDIYIYIHTHPHPYTHTHPYINNIIKVILSVLDQNFDHGDFLYICMKLKVFGEGG